MNSYSIDLIKFKALDDNEAKCLLLWFEDIKNRFDIEISFQNTILNENYCDLSFEFRKFKVEIQGDYVVLTLYNHPTEYYIIYKMDFDEVYFK